MANVGTVTFDVAAEVAKLRTELDKVRKDVSGLRQTGKDMGDAITSGFNSAQRALATFGVAFSVSAITAGFIRAAGAAIELGDEIGKAATKAGIAASTMSELAYAARANDVDLGTLSTSLRKMQDGLSLAAAGNTKAAATIEALGLSVLQLRAIAPDEQFEAFAQAISLLRDPADRARFAVDVFGKAGADLLPLMERGAAGVRSLREEAKSLGAAMSDEQIQRLQNADEAVKRLKQSFSSLATTLVAKAAPALVSFMDTVRVQIAGTQIEKLRKEIEGLEELLATPGGRARFSGLEGRIATLRAEERRIKEALTPPKSLAETRGRRPLEIGAQDPAATENPPPVKKPETALDRFVNRQAGSGIAGAQDASRTVMRNGSLVSETLDQASSMEALGNEAQLEAQRVLNEQKLALEQEFTAGKLAEIQNRESLVSELVRGSEDLQSQYRFAAYMSWSDIIGLGIQSAAAGNKRLAKIQQGFALVQAIWNTATGITSALSRQDYAGAAKIAAMGAIQVLKIKSTQYSDSGGGGSASSSVGGGESGGAVADRNGAQTPEAEVQNARPAATIIVQGNIMSTRESAEWFIEQVREAVTDRDVVLIPATSRQALELAGVGS